MTDAGECNNTDREIWRGPDEGNGDYYADSLHVTKDDALGINCGGHVIVKPIRDWHRLGLAQTQSQPVAWRYQMKEGWDGIWRVVTVFPTFESPLNWRVEPLYAALAPGNGAVEAERTQSVNKVLHQSSFEAAWAAFQNTGIDLVADSDDETCRCLHNAISAYLASAPSPAALDPVTVERCAKVIAEISQREAGMTDSLHSGLAGASRRDALGDAYDAVRALIGQPASNGEPVAYQRRWKNSPWEDIPLDGASREQVEATLQRWRNSDCEIRALYAFPSNPQDAVTSTHRPEAMPEKLSPTVIAACVGGGITSDQITHIYYLIRAAVSLYGDPVPQTDHAKAIPTIGNNCEMPMPDGFSLVDDGRFCATDDPDCRHPECDCKLYRRRGDQ